MLLKFQRGSANVAALCEPLMDVECRRFDRHRTPGEYRNRWGASLLFKRDGAARFRQDA